MRRPKRERRSLRIAAATAAAILAVSAIAIAGCTSGSAGSSGSSSAASQSQQYSSSKFVIDNDNPMAAFAANSASILLGGFPGFDDSGDSSASSGSSGASGASEATFGVSSNSCYSPASYYMALAMLAAGADGEAQKQLVQALGARDSAELVEYCKNQMESICRTDESGATKFANSLWSNTGYTFSNGYRSTIEKYFNGGAFDIQFGTPGTNSMIRSWISNNTEGLLNPDISTDPDMVAMLVNTIYFKDNWMDPFVEEATDTEAFHAESGDVDAQFMHGTTDFGTYIMGPNFTAAQLPFAGESNMTFFLPNEDTSIQDLIGTPAGLLELLEIQPDSTANINWTLPKFTLESKFDNLAAVAKSMGVTSIFDEGNTWMFRTMIISNENSDLDFFISDVLQETYIGIDEYGAEAAAFTSMAMRVTSLEPEQAETIDFVLDRPFVYTISSSDGTPLFIGVVANPAA